MANNLESVPADQRITRRTVLRTGAGVAAGLTLGPLAAACGSSGGGSGSGLKYWTHNFPPANTLNKELIKEFEKKNSVKVSWDYSPHADFEPKLLTAFAGGGGPDVYWCGDWLMPQFIPKKLAAPFDAKSYGVASQEAFINRYDPHTFDAFMGGGKLYTGGISEYDTFSLIYSKPLFREARIPYPSETKPLTWDDMVGIARKLTLIKNGKRVRSGWEFTYNVPIWAVLQIEPMVRQLGGELVDPSTGKPQFDSDPVLKVMDYYATLRNQYHVNDQSWPSTDTGADMGHGRIAMFIAGPWFIPDILAAVPKMKGEIGVAPLPTWERGGTRVTTKYAWAWQVNPRSPAEQQKLGWKFLSFLTSKPDQWWNDCGYVEPLKHHWSYMLAKQPLLRVFRSDYAYGQYEFRSQHYLELSKILMQAFQKVESGQSAGSVMKSAQADAMNAIG